MPVHTEQTPTIGKDESLGHNLHSVTSTQDTVIKMVKLKRTVQKILIITYFITFSHLADAFIQSDLQMRTRIENNTLLILINRYKEKK